MVLGIAVKAHLAKPGRYLGNEIFALAQVFALGNLRCIGHYPLGAGRGMKEQGIAVLLAHIVAHIVAGFDYNIIIAHRIAIKNCEAYNGKCSKRFSSLIYLKYGNNP